MHSVYKIISYYWHWHCIQIKFKSANIINELVEGMKIIVFILENDLHHIRNGAIIDST